MQFDSRRNLIAATALFFSVVSQGVAANQSDLGIAPAQNSAALRFELPALDRQGKLETSGAKTGEERGPLRYAEKIRIDPVAADSSRGWTTLPDGRQVWRARVHARQATSIELGFTRFQLPEGAQLTVRGNDGQRVRGPYTPADNESHGQLWVPIVEGDTATAELVLEPGVRRSEVDLVLTHVLQGFLAFWDPSAMAKVSEPCNVDVECPVADSWDEAIRSTARLALEGNLCTGSLVNNTSYDGRPLFLTAEHCINVSWTDLEPTEYANTAVVYWNYENSGCRSPGTDAAEGQGDGTLDHAQSGATLLAMSDQTDFALLELDDVPKPVFNAWYSGWDRRDLIFDGGVTIHHPEAQEKRITFTEDPFELVPVLTEPNTGLLVSTWTRGLTEQGSSGAGLWSPGRRLIGQLSGGPWRGCDDIVQDDVFGRLAIAWEGEGGSETRLMDYLDPLETQAKVIGGKGPCQADSGEIIVAPEDPTVGTQVTLELAGADGGLTVDWDLDGDRVSDQRGASIQTRFTKGGSKVVAATVSQGGQGCQATYEKALTIQDTGVSVSIGERLVECGDSDGIMEPGERWSMPVALTNEGEASIDGVYAVFSRDGVTAGAKDEFGYEMLDSRSARCPYDFIWPVGGQSIEFSASSERSLSSDEGYSEPIWMRDFRFYGEKVPKLVMSTNGYLSTSTESDGSDLTNDCPLPAQADFDAVGGRLMPFHGDFGTGKAWSRYFDKCPRLGDTSRPSGGCRIFQWNEYRENPFFDGNMPFQAILYSETNEVVFQYGTSTPDPTVAPSVGIQNEGGTVGLTYGCKSAFFEDAPAEPHPESAVCFFAPNNPPEGPTANAVSLPDPALEYGTIESGETVTRVLEFRVPAEAACGDELGIKLHGVRFDGGFTPGPGVILTGTVGGDEAACNANAWCGAAKADEIDFTRGMWFNPARDGHGIDVHTAGETGFLVWYTYENGRKPIWYQAVGFLRDNQIHGDLLRFSLNPGEPLQLAADCTAPHSNPRCEDVGEAMFTALSEDTGLFHWTLDGQHGGEQFEVLKASSAAADRHTGHWFPPLEPGWGLTVNQQGSVEFGVLYFYDDAGDPTWALGVQGDTPGLVPLDQFTGFCPSCPWVKTSGKRVGDYTRTFSTLTQGSVDVDVDLRPPLKGAWQREDVEIRLLSEPIP